MEIDPNAENGGGLGGLGGMLGGGGA